MCGIAGIVRFDGKPADDLLLRTMTERLTHRGPDEEGVWFSGPVGLGHRRLSIIDIASSSQPMASPDDRLHLCFNGEILNYRRLRDGLSYPFRTDGDTETLLAAHVVHGPGATELLDGQFAYALHDSATGELTLVRDRLGILPLYYHMDANRIVFASEIKALLPALESGPEIDTASLDSYLGQRSVPAPFTLFAGVRKLPPGHRLRVVEGRARLERYWSIPDGTRTEVTGPQAVAEVEAALRRAVEAATVADVPVGAYLSGGVDSSLIVALVNELRGGSGVDTFAAGFADQRYDELPFARRVSDLIGTRHHEVVLSPADFTDLWPRLTWHRDAPISEASDFAVFRLAELARRHVTVVLSGEGSDELFGGYPKYRVAPKLARMARLPAPLRVPVVEAVQRRLPPAAARARIALRTLSGATEEDRNLTWFAPFTGAERAELVGRWPTHPRARASRDGDLVRRMLAADCASWLPDNLLERGDRMSMAASLELRPPFLDHRLVELAFSLPSDVKVRRGITKWVVKEVARRRLPAEIVDRPKVGFRVPMDAWFRGGLEAMAWDLLTARDSLASTLLDRAAVQRLLHRHRSGVANEEARIWPLLSLEVWHRTFFLGEGVPEGQVA
ncbi:asparagine synthase (glutamine-hydrolyzing) [Pseudonocardia kujensis]|uniref:asparagine synthase (glutamine-hydrolyzing) n=1 Tax=Pseudonocardia kujensis TaxID=1128675 RepID=UPI001E5938F4|nr:asparagine synthase (glutamine-hydrolyzing) [Pseudonocardia kujensis]MCE0763120.1 asparagine synthase (glutamine-hydrolyzing) [Pseudonocardia kujensis]